MNLNSDIGNQNLAVFSNFWNMGKILFEIRPKMYGGWKLFLSSLNKMLINQKKSM